jgi:hypothetical protein
MKTPAFYFFLVAVLISAAITLHGRTSTPQLDQRELFRQFEGKWQAFTGPDTLETCD